MPIRMDLGFFLLGIVFSVFIMLLVDYIRDEIEKRKRKKEQNKKKSNIDKIIQVMLLMGIYAYVFVSVYKIVTELIK